MKVPTFEISQSKYGRRAVLGAIHWLPDLPLALKQNDIREIVISSAGFDKNRNLDLIADLPFIHYLMVTDLSLTRDGAVCSLTNLRELHLHNFTGEPLEIRRLSKLEAFSVGWRKGIDSLFQCGGLKSLAIRKFPGKNLEQLQNLSALEWLDLCESRVVELKGIEHLSRLKWLRLGALKKLEIMHGLRHLTRLEVLIIGSCGSLKSIDEIAEIPNLRKLHMENLRNLNSVKNFQKATQLEEMFMTGYTSVADGDLSSLCAIPKLRRLGFRPRRHYSHTFDDITKARAKSQLSPIAFPQRGA